MVLCRGHLRRHSLWPLQVSGTAAEQLKLPEPLVWAVALSKHHRLASAIRVAQADKALAGAKIPETMSPEEWNRQAAPFKERAARAIDVRVASVVEGHGDDMTSTLLCGCEVVRRDGIVTFTRRCDAPVRVMGGSCWT